MHVSKFIRGVREVPLKSHWDSAHVSRELWRVESIEMKVRLNSTNKPRGVFGHGCRDKEVATSGGSAASVTIHRRVLLVCCFPFFFLFLFQGTTTAGCRQKHREWHSKDALGCYYRALPT